jgi:uncharacterized protein YbjT (DUF2867 family)
MSDPIEERRRPRLAIAGATGRVGAALVHQLVADPVEVVALTRDPGAACLPSGVEIVGVDFDAPATLADALQGVDRLFLAHGSSDRQVANEIALIDAAMDAGVSHIVKLSSMGPPAKVHPFDWHMAIEAHLATKAMGYTVLRPGPYADILGKVGSAVAADNWGGSAGDGLVNFIDTRDIADVARLALLDAGSVDVQRAYHLTGPAPVTMSDVAQLLSQLLGREIVYRHRTPAEQRNALIASGFSETAADLRLGLEKLFNESVLAETTSTVAQLTKRAPRALSDWLASNLSLFRN